MTTGTSIRAAVVAVLAVAAWTVPYSAGRAAATELAASEPQAQVIVVTGDFESRSVALGTTNRWSSIFRATSRTCWWPIPRSPTP